MIRQSIEDNLTPRMTKRIDVFATLSRALDLAADRRDGHAIRAAWMGYWIGRELIFTQRQLADLLTTILLKDIGMVSAGLSASEEPFGRLADRVAHITRLFNHGTDARKQPIARDIALMERVGAQLDLAPAVGKALRSIDERWDGRGGPDRLEANAVPLAAVIARVAEMTEIVWSTSGIASAQRAITRRYGTWFSPDVVGAFERAAAHPRFWQRLVEPQLMADIAALEPASQRICLDTDKFEGIAHAFATIIDARSRYTDGHSTRVATLADGIAAELGFSPVHRARLRRAALLHDLGKLAIPSATLDKAGPLNEQEWQAIREVPQIGADILDRLPAFEDIAAIIATQHERLDGSGYPSARTADTIGLFPQIIGTADMFDALTSARAYRPALPVRQALRILGTMAGGSLSLKIVEALTALRVQPDTRAATA